MTLPVNDAGFFGTLLESIFYGIYFMVFSVFIWTDRKSMRPRTVFFYPTCLLFVLITTYLVLDFIGEYYAILYPESAPGLNWSLRVATSAVESFVDFISQLIIIYRCWHMWNRSNFMIIPGVLSLASLAGSLSLVGELNARRHTRNLNNLPVWWIPMGVTAFSLSLLVNAIVTSLLVFKIISESRHTRSSGHISWRRNIKPIVALLIETGLMTFIGQLAWTISYSLQSTVFSLVAGVVIMLYGISPTIIHVRAALGGSCQKSKGAVESAMRFADHTPPLKDSVSDPGSNPSSSVTFINPSGKETETV